LWRGGRVDEALTRLTDASAVVDGTAIEPRVLRARLLEAAERSVESEATWRGIADDEPALRAFALDRLVGLAAARGAATDADAYLTALTDGRPTRVHLARLLAVAEALLAANDLNRAERRYRELLRLARPGATADRGRMGLAAIHEANGDVARAIARYRETQLEFRSAAAFVEARAAERRLARAAGRAPGPMTADQSLDLVRRLRSTARYGTALEVIDAWAEAHAGAAEAEIIDLERIETLYAQRANDAAIARCADFTVRYPSSRQLPRVRLIRFRLAVRLGRTDEVTALGGELWNDLNIPAGVRRDTGTLLGAYLVAVGDVEAGLDVYRELFRITRRAADQRTILWRAGVAALRAGQLERAATNLRGLVRRRPSGDLAPAALYWQGIAEQRLGRTPAALTAFRSLTARYPYHYYGVRAADRLREDRLAEDPLVEAAGSGLPVPLAFPALTLSHGTRAAAELRAATLLARAGLPEDAAASLLRLLDRQSRDRGLALLTARALADAGEFGLVSRVIINHFGEFLCRPADDLPPDFWQLVYPRPFWDAVRPAAEANGLDPLMLYAVMRQESRFDPQARSAVGALGLFQIMPYTAAELGPRVGVGDVSDDEAAMVRPDVNAAIGARLAGSLLDMFDGHLAPVAASYNAGEDLARVWWAAAEGWREDYFVDAIPYSETRRFVREVLTNYATYRRLYGDGAPSPRRP